MADIVLRTTPEDMQKQSEWFDRIAKEVKRRFDRIESISAKTKGYWQGDTGDRDRESYASYKEDINFIVRRLEEHPRDLLTTAGIFIETEKSVASTNAQLKTDQIV